jgi:hypothetical protein
VWQVLTKGEVDGQADPSRWPCHCSGSRTRSGEEPARWAERVAVREGGAGPTRHRVEAGDVFVKLKLGRASFRLTKTGETNTGLPRSIEECFEAAKAGIGRARPV